MTSDKFILDRKGNPVAEGDLLAWARWMQTNSTRRRVAYSKVGTTISVSTVFLGLDYSFPISHEKPLLFETMVFGGKNDKYIARCSTKQEAVEQHRNIVKKVTKKEDLY